MSLPEVKRSNFLDQVRGLAIILMVIFHFAYDLNFFRLVDIDFFHDPLWYYFPRLITFLFLICVGMALTLTHRPQIRWKKALKRSGMLALWAALISLTTYALFPERFIYFGILHCIALASLAALPMINYPWICLIVGLPMIVLGVFFNLTLPWFNLSQPAIDYIPFFPWFGATLIGIFLGKKGLTNIQLKFKYQEIIEKLGQHSLIIYLLHQPILFGLLYAVWYLFLRS